MSIVCQWIAKIDAAHWVTDRGFSTFDDHRGCGDESEDAGDNDGVEEHVTKTVKCSGSWGTCLTYPSPL